MKRTSIQVDSDVAQLLRKEAVAIAGFAQHHRPLFMGEYVALLADYAQAHPDLVSQFLRDRVPPG